MASSEREIRLLVRQKVADGLAAPVPAHTQRDIPLSKVRDKAMVVIGMRRSGKTTFLWQCFAERLAAGMPRDAVLYFSFEDERLAEMAVGDLQKICSI